MHVVSTAMFTMIHASVTRGGDAIDEAGMLRVYRGVIVHDRLAMYWKLKAEHGLCGAHLLHDLADVAGAAIQTAIGFPFRSLSKGSSAESSRQSLVPQGGHRPLPRVVRTDPPTGGVATSLETSGLRQGVEARPRMVGTGAGEATGCR